MDNLDNFVLLATFFRSNGIDVTEIVRMDKLRIDSFIKIAKEWKIKNEIEDEILRSEEEQMTQEEIIQKKKKDFENLLYHSSGSI